MAHNMEYNSEKDTLIIPEYGRNVQQLIQHAKTIENDDERQAFVEHIVELMMQMHPQNRNLDDYRDKMWRHVFRIAEFDLNVMPPNGHQPSAEEAYKKPDKIPYPQNKARYRHYGDNVQKLIDKAVAMEEGPKQKGFAGVIGSYMKLAYRTWNQEHYVSDDIIKNDLETLSDGKLVMDDDASIENLTNIRSTNNNNNNNRRRGRRDNHRNHNKGRSRGRKRK
ncbi:MAG TPA: DUF4290 domain-containing protein [Saprospiraceae bacterium]|nr:DUF4290 domain-containing protein [Saprospiraceae bacterium]